MREEGVLLAPPTQAHDNARSRPKKANTSTIQVFFHKIWKTTIQKITGSSPESWIGSAKPKTRLGIACSTLYIWHEVFPGSYQQTYRIFRTFASERLSSLEI